MWEYTIWDVLFVSVGDVTSWSISQSKTEFSPAYRIMSHIQGKVKHVTLPGPRDPWAFTTTTERTGVFKLLICISMPIYGLGSCHLIAFVLCHLNSNWLQLKWWKLLLLRKLLDLHSWTSFPLERASALRFAPPRGTLDRLLLHPCGILARFSHKKIQFPATGVILLLQEDTVAV